MFVTLLSFNGLHQALLKDKATYQEYSDFPIHKALQASNNLTGNKMPPSQ